jgi:hypothetical protein
MTWIMLCVAIVVLLVSLIVSQRRRPRDLLRTDPNLNWVYRVTRWIGNGMVFFAVVYLVRWLWLGVAYSLWTKDALTLIALALSGVGAVIVTSAKRGAEADKRRAADPIRTWGYRATRCVGNGLAFFAAIQLMAWLVSGTTYSFWPMNGMATVGLGLTGAAIAFATSAKREAASAK